MKSFILAAGSLAAALMSVPPAFAQSAEPKINQLIVYGDDPCPAGTADEIVVCARKPDSDRYRIPEALRDNPNDPRNESWANRALELSYLGRSGIGSCSTVGPGGMIGCYDQLVRAARAEQAGNDEINWNRLVGDARQERLDRIDAEAEAVERELSDDE
ncbi:MAG: hypothetical protein H0W74_12940 [Sphingosinicella sp.]|nr:hypothetical protein [Sphingosinicella sp.]